MVNAVGMWRAARRRHIIPDFEQEDYMATTTQMDGSDLRRRRSYSSGKG